MATNPPPPSRRQINDERLRDAALAEVVDHGADSLGPTAVARRAGLSTGAVYNRFEDTTELLVDLWTSRCQQAGTDLMNIAMEALLGNDGDAKGDVARRQLVEALANPSPAVSALIELIVIAHRDEALAEVVIPGGTAMIAGHGVTRSADPDQRAKAALVVSLLLGMLLLDASGVEVEPDWAEVEPDWAEVEPDWERTFGGMAVRLRQRIEPAGEPEMLTLPELPSGDEIDDDPTRAALMLACMEVIGRVGLQRATVTRIARRAGLTHGAIYGLFGSKEELVATAVAELTDKILGLDRDFNRVQYERFGDYPATVSAVLAGFTDGRRRSWQLFRLECHLAQRHDPAVAGALDAVYSRTMAHDAVTFTQLLGLDVGMAKSRARMQMAVPLGRIMLQALIPGAMDEVDWRRSAGLLG